MKDLIDRGQAIEAIRDAQLRVAGVHIGKSIIRQYAEKCRAGLIEAVENVPPVNDVEEVRHEYWIDIGKTAAGSKIIQCSGCKVIRKGAGKSKYCRDCGAKMDRSSEATVVD